MEVTIFLLVAISLALIVIYKDISLYIRTKKYPKTINFKDVEFVEEGKEVEINMVSGQNEFIDFKKYEKEFEESKTKGYIDVNGLFINIDNIESTTLCKRGTAIYKDLKLSYTIYRGEVEMYKCVKGRTIFYTSRNEKFNKIIIWKVLTPYKKHDIMYM